MLVDQAIAHVNPPDRMMVQKKLDAVTVQFSNQHPNAKYLVPLHQRESAKIEQAIAQQPPEMQQKLYEYVYEAVVMPLLQGEDQGNPDLIFNRIRHVSKELRGYLGLPEPIQPPGGGDPTVPEQPQVPEPQRVAPPPVAPQEPTLPQ